MRAKNVGDPRSPAPQRDRRIGVDAFRAEAFHLRAPFVVFDRGIGARGVVRGALDGTSGTLDAVAGSRPNGIVEVSDECAVLGLVVVLVSLCGHNCRRSSQAVALVKRSGVLPAA